MLGRDDPRFRRRRTAKDRRCLHHGRGADRGSGSVVPDLTLLITEEPVCVYKGNLWCPTLPYARRNGHGYFLYLARFAVSRRASPAPPTLSRAAGTSGPCRWLSWADRQTPRPPGP